jgi:hypothetical protein
MLQPKTDDVSKDVIETRLHIEGKNKILISHTVEKMKNVFQIRSDIFQNMSKKQKFDFNLLRDRSNQIEFSFTQNCDSTRNLQDLLNECTVLFKKMHTFKNSLIQTTNKRERSSSISSFFLPSAQRPTKIAKNTEEYTHKLTGIVYAYCYKLDGTFAYIGQTRQSLEVRDYQHRFESKTKFDKLYIDDETNVFTKPFILATKDFEETGKDFDNVEAQCKKKCCDWMNEKEIYFIEKHETYHSSKGLNMTTGGQYLNRHFSFFLANIKKRNARWKNEIMPAFRECEWGKKNRLWEIPFSTKVLGVLINNMRCGRSTIPPQYLEELNEIGFMNGNGVNFCRFKVVYMPAFRASEYAKQKEIWKIPQNTKVLGTLLNCMRQGRTPIPDAFRNEINEMGFCDGKSFTFCKFKFVYMPALRNSTFGQNKRIWSIPRKYPVIGRMLNSIRNGDLIVPSLFVSELNLLGFLNGAPPIKIKWEVDYLPICKNFIENNPNNKKLDEMSSKCKINDINIGDVIYHLKRNAPKSLENLPESILNELRAMGLTI